jgi:hypothetical protein
MPPRCRQNRPYELARRSPPHSHQFKANCARDVIVTSVEVGAPSTPVPVQWALLAPACEHTTLVTADPLPPHPPSAAVANPAACYREIPERVGGIE